MVGTGIEGPDWLEVASQLVGDHDTGLPKTRHEPCQEKPCGFGVPTGLHEDIERVAIGVNHPPEPVILAADRKDDLVQMPLARRRGTVTSNTIGELDAKSVDPNLTHSRLTITQRSARRSLMSAVLRAKL